MRFTNDHQWIEMDGDVARLGLTAYACQQLGDVFEVALPARGKALNAGDAMAGVQAARRNADLPAPIAGEVAEVNAELFDEPDLINAGPESLGWMVKLKPADPKQVDSLMDRTAYEAYLDGL
ncbi:MAG TPA: glycine cleavage system protein GcvH [Caulobacteraceae bacterium]|jgi:glycine cleavage system H protein